MNPDAYGRDGIMPDDSKAIQGLALTCAGRFDRLIAR
jgi:hypothetical protein